MSDYYDETFSKLIDLVKTSRNKCFQNRQNIDNRIGALFTIGDSNYGIYSSMVELNEYRAVKFIENLAASLLQKQEKNQFMLYPVDPRYKNLDAEEQVKGRQFKIILNENNQKVGVVFCAKGECGEYYQHFVNGDYSVDKLKLVLLIEPDEMAYDMLIKSRNDYNLKNGVPLIRVTLKEFWKQQFGEEEYSVLAEHIKRFNDEVKTIIGFNTIISPTESALQKFRKKTGEMLCSFPYREVISDDIYQKQFDIFYRNYMERSLWRAMIGDSNFAISFITSEWNYNVYQLSENLDLTGIVCGYFKSIEQLIWSIMKLKTKPFKIKSKSQGIIKYSEENEDIIDATLYSLEQVIKFNDWMIKVNPYARKYMIQVIDDWRGEYRNNYLHKRNLQSIEVLNEIRNKTILLYFLILGGFEITESDYEKLGINRL